MTADASYDFTLSAAPRLAVSHVGNAHEPLLVIDGIMRDARQLVEYAAANGRFSREGLGLYPGLRSPAPLDYVEAVARAAAPIIERAFGLEAVKLARAECSFSIAASRPSDLEPKQRLPHIDTTYPLQFALLHYLCSERHGGTAFYRQRRTGFETIGADREAAYLAALEEDLAAHAGEEPAYITGSGPTYEQIGSVEARFDRIVIYRSCLLHSGQVREGSWEKPEPRTGRLTGNIFLSFRQTK
jgi:hypothetical protein